MEDNANETKPTEAEAPRQIINVQTPDEGPQDSIIPTVEAAGDPPADEVAPETSEPANPALDASSDAPDPQSETIAGDATLSTSVDHKAGAPIAVILTAVLVALGLVVVTVYAYIKDQRDNKPTTTQTTTQPQTDTTVNQVDDTSKEIDDALNSTNDATDFPENELSDQSLNL